MIDIVITVFGVGCIVLLWIMIYDSNRFVVREFSVSDRRIIKRMRAVVIADLHNKQYGKENERLLAAIREQKPDCIFVAGDIPTAKPGETMEPALHLLRELVKDYPVHYGNGNHEHRLKLYQDTYGDMGERYGQALGEMGISPMVNSHAVLNDYGIAVYGAEIGREYYRRFKLQGMDVGYLQEILGKPDESFYTVLLAHNPDYFPQYARWGADLILSGHVHGGVVRVPFWGKGAVSPSMRLFPKYDGGIYRDGRASMVLSRGLGMHTIPFRLFNPGELWVVDFKPEPLSE